MPVLIFGTSNSLMKNGWVQGLVDILGEKNVENMSVGMSPSTRFSAHANLDFSKYDAVFFDAIPNDEYLIEDTDDFNSTAEILDRIFFEISQKTALIVVGFCISPNVLTPSKTFMRHQELCRKNGGIFVDIRDLVLETSERFGVDYRLLYEDHEAHPERRLARQIARSIAANLPDTGNIPTGKYITTAPKTSIFSSINQDDHAFSNFKKIEARSSALSARFARIREGDLVQFNANYTTGAYINIGTTNGVIRLHSSDNQAEIKLYLSRHMKKDFLLTFIPFPLGVKFCGISIHPEASAKSISSRYSNSHSGLGDIQLDICEICFYSLEGDTPGIATKPIGYENLHERTRSHFFSRENSKILSGIVQEIAIKKSASKENEMSGNIEKWINFGKSIKDSKSLVEFFDLLTEEFGFVPDAYKHHIFHVEKIRELLRRKEWDLAQISIQNIPKKYCHDGWPYCLVARAQTKAGLKMEAENSWKLLHNLNPNNKEAREGLGIKSTNFQS
ncbi:hypothetical protein [Mangrovicoccus ximenensis]|uniref:hypothetical protein n=1 Tax=Mangrovicoccus ximenensis TaxID=1911570 RepID=UPI0011AE1A1E|nr:hypothetical protein [Mangrovicoccus ximenensis]